MTGFTHLALETERLRLRPFTDADAPDLLAMFANAEVSRFLSRPAWTDIAQAKDRIARDIKGMADSDYVRLALTRREDGAFVGECCLFAFNLQSRRAELGYGLTRGAWGQGYMTEALRAFVGWAFEGPLAFNRLEADIDPRNEASARSLQRLGFLKEGHLRERWVVAGEVSDTALYGLLRSDWPPR